MAGVGLYAHCDYTLAASRWKWSPFVEILADIISGEDEPGLPSDDASGDLGAEGEDGSLLVA